MTPAEIRAKADELRATLQALAGQKFGWGMDATIRKVLQAAFHLVGMVGDLAQHVEKLSDDVNADKADGGKSEGEV